MTQTTAISEKTTLNNKQKKSAIAEALEKKNQELVMQAKEGNERAKSQLCTVNNEHVMFLMLKYTKFNRELAEDLTQEVMIKMVQSLDTYSNMEFKFTTWLSKIAQNLYIDYVRKRKTNIDTYTKTVDFSEQTGTDDEANNYSSNRSILKRMTSSSVEEDLINDNDEDMRVKFVREAINDIKNPIHKDVIKMRIVDEMSYKDIAAKSGETMTNVKALILRTKVNILKKLVLSNLGLIKGERCKEIMLLSFGKGMSSKDIAKKFKITETAVDGILKNGLKKIQVDAYMPVREKSEVDEFAV